MKKKLISVFVLLLFLISTAAASASDRSLQPQAAGKANAMATASQAITQEKYPDFVLVHDEAGLMNASQQKELEDKLENISKAHNIRVAVLTMEALPANRDIAAYAEKYLFAHYRDLENTQGSIILVQVTADRSYRVTTDSNMMEIITNEDGYPYLEDEFLSSMKDDDYYDAYMKFADGVDYLCSYYEDEGKAYDPYDMFSPGGLLLGILMSCIIGYLFYSFLAGRMSNVTGSDNAAEYLDNSSFILNQHEDVFLYTTTRVIHHERDHGHGGGSGGGSGSSGGGGGHY